MPQKWSLLSITDPHYEQPDANYLDDNKDQIPSALRDNIFANFNRIIQSGFARAQFDLIAICGDITTHGNPHGFDRFFGEAVAALQLLVPRRDAVCIVPGNHDVVWGLKPTDTNSFDSKFANFREKLVDKTGVTSCMYPDGQLCDKPGETLHLQFPPNGPLYDDHDRKLLVVCINSSIRCGELNGVMLARR
jgi:3',5'-cyclic AMP phosphodiesterase CpdA